MDENEKFLVDFGETTVIGGGAVDSVNGYTGNVVLTTSDLENTSDYQNSTQVQNIVNEAVVGKQDTLTAGANITIDGDTISATDTTYTAGTGLNLSGTEFSVNTNAIATKQDISNEATARENADINLQGQIDAISASSDVTDIVGTYAELQAYDTTNLKDNDIIKVLQDESKDDETTYYRWSTTTQTFTLIGEEGPYYTKAATDLLLADKQNKLTAGSNIAIAPDNTISATDTTYSDFVGTDGTSAGTAGLVPAPATTDADKFLKADGTWDTAGSAINVVQSTGTSTTDVMSQDATTKLAYPDVTNKPNGIKIGAEYTGRTIGNESVSLGPWATGTTQHAIAIGANAYASGATGPIAIGQGATASKQNSIGIGYNVNSGGNDSVVIGPSATGTQAGSVSVGYNARSTSTRAVALGYQAAAVYTGSVALGPHASTSAAGEVNIGSSETSYGYNSSNYRLISGVYDGQSAHDAATYGQVISYSALNGAGAPTTATEGKYVGQLYYDTTNEAMYFLKTIDTTTTPATYTWEALGGGGSQYNIYSTKTTSNSTTGGAIYLGNLNANQEQQEDPTTTDAHRKYFWALPYANNIIPGSGSINILGEVTRNNLSNVISLKGGDVTSSNTVAIGSQYTRSAESVAIGAGSVIDSSGSGGVALGYSAKVYAPGGIALGYQSSSTRAGEVNIGAANTSYGYNSTNYRIITGVHDGIDAHSAATVAQGNTLATSAPTTSTVGVLGQLYTDTTNMHTYQCTAISGDTYTWTQRW